MHPPLTTPAFLSRDPIAGPEICDFDLQTQSVPDNTSFSGVCVMTDFISRSEESELLDTIEATPFLPAQSGKEKQHFGPKVNFKKRKVNTELFAGLPAYARRLETRVRSQLAARVGCSGAPEAMAAYQTTDVFVLRYRPERASNLDFHRDDDFAYGDAILNLSLESPSVLTFLPTTQLASLDRCSACVRVPLPARSLVLLYGRARYDWAHGLLSSDIAEQRTSITLRTISPELRMLPEGLRILEIAAGG